MYITYKYLLQPNSYQIKNIEKTIDYANLVRDICIRKNEMCWARQGSKELLNKYIQKYPKLKTVDYSALINALFDIMDVKTDYRSTRESYASTYSDFLRINFPINSRKVYLPKIGWVNYKQHRELPDLKNIIKMIIKRNKLDEYYIYFIVSVKEDEGVILDIENSIGLDYSSTYFAVDSNGDKHPVERFFRDTEKKKKSMQKNLRRKKPGSKNYKEEEKQIFKLEKKTADKRRDSLHKLSTELANKYDYIFIEDLSMKHISKQGHLSKATYDNAYYSFVQMLEYKMQRQGKKLVKVSKWYPSSKTCNKCGYIYDGLMLKEREWKCSNCNELHNRDVNAAINIRKEGIRIITAGQSVHPGKG